jgi:hypothetical protein
VKAPDGMVHARSALRRVDRLKRAIARGFISTPDARDLQSGSMFHFDISTPDARDLQSGSKFHFDAHDHDCHTAPQGADFGTESAELFHGLNRTIARGFISTPDDRDLQFGSKFQLDAHNHDCHSAPQGADFGAESAELYQGQTFRKSLMSPQCDVSAKLTHSVNCSPASPPCVTTAPLGAALPSAPPCAANSTTEYLMHRIHELEKFVLINSSPKIISIADALDSAKAVAPTLSSSSSSFDLRALVESMAADLRHSEPSSLTKAESKRFEADSKHTEADGRLTDASNTERPIAFKCGTDQAVQTEVSLETRDVALGCTHIGAGAGRPVLVHQGVQDTRWPSNHEGSLAVSPSSHSSVLPCGLFSGFALDYGSFAVVPTQRHVPGLAHCGPSYDIVSEAAHLLEAARSSCLEIGSGIEDGPHYFASLASNVVAVRDPPDDPLEHSHTAGANIEPPETLTIGQVKQICLQQVEEAMAGFVKQNEANVGSVGQDLVCHGQLREAVSSVLEATHAAIDRATSTSLQMMKNHAADSTAVLRDKLSLLDSLVQQLMASSPTSVLDNIVSGNTDSEALGHLLSSFEGDDSSFGAAQDPTSLFEQSFEGDTSGLGAAHVPTSLFEQAFSRDAVYHPSDKQLERLVQHLNRNTLDEEKFGEIFCSRSQKKANSAQKAQSASIAHSSARHLGTRTYDYEGCQGGDEFDGAQVRLDCAPAGSQLGGFPQVGSCGAADGSPAEPALGTNEQISP